MSDPRAKSLKDCFLSMSDREVDPIAKKLIGKWRHDDKPTALELLEPLDMCIHGALASGWVVRALTILYNEACAREGTTHERVAALAPWRKEGPLAG